MKSVRKSVRISPFGIDKKSSEVVTDDIGKTVVYEARQFLWQLLLFIIWLGLIGLAIWAWAAGALPVVFILAIPIVILTFFMIPIIIDFIPWMI